MSDFNRRISRREFVRGAAALAVVGFGPGGRAAGKTAGQPENGGAGYRPPRVLPARSRVVLVRDEKVLDAARKIDAKVLSDMLDRGVCALTGQTDVSAAWGTLVSPADTVGIKSNAWRHLGTPPELEQALLKNVRLAGVPQERIAVDDRGILQNPVFLKATCLINARPLRTHHWAGVGGCIKNYIMFSEDPPSWHDDSCANLAGVWDLPVCRDKTRLNVLVMLTPLFHGKGPHHFNANYTWEYKGLLLSADPVAADATGLRILMAKRRAHFGNAEPLSVPPRHIEVAEKKYRLGNADPARMELVTIGWDKDRLI